MNSFIISYSVWLYFSSAETLTKNNKKRIKGFVVDECFILIYFLAHSSDNMKTFKFTFRFYFLRRSFGNFGLRVPRVRPLGEAHRPATVGAEEQLGNRRHLGKSAYHTSSEGNI